MDHPNRYYYPKELTSKGQLRQFIEKGAIDPEEPPPKNLGHVDLIDALEEETKWRGWTLTDPHIAIYPRGARKMVVSFCATHKDYELEKGMVYLLGASNDLGERGGSVRLYGGVALKNKDLRVVLSEHRAWRPDRYSADKVSERGWPQYEHSIDPLPALIDSWQEECARFSEAIAFLRGIVVEHEDWPEIFVAGLRGRLAPAFRFAKIDKQLKEEEQLTAWDIALLFAEQAKENPPISRMEQMFKFYQLLFNFGIKLNES